MLLYIVVEVEPALLEDEDEPHVIRFDQTNPHFSTVTKMALTILMTGDEQRIRDLIRLQRTALRRIVLHSPHEINIRLNDLQV